MSGSTTMKASEFKAQCLELMDRVAASGEVIVITKRGKAVAQLTALPVAKPRTLGGYFKDKLDFMGDVLSPIDVAWGPAEPSITPPKAKQRRGAKR